MSGVADRALGDQLARRLVRRAEEVSGRAADAQAAAIGLGEELAALRDRRRDRLLGVDVLAGLERGAHHGGVRGGRREVRARRRSTDPRSARRPSTPRRPCTSANASARLCVEVGAGDDVERVERGRALDVRLRDDPAADDADASRSCRVLEHPLHRARTSARRRRAPEPSGLSCSTTSHSTPARDRRRQRRARSRRRRRRPGSPRASPRARKSLTCTSGQRPVVRSSSATGSAPASQTQPRSSSSQTSSAGSARSLSSTVSASSSVRELAPVVVEAEAQPVLARARARRRRSARRSARASSLDSGGSIQLSAIRSQPSVRSSSASAGSSRLERVQAGVPAGGDEPELVEPRAHLRRVVAVQVEELDTVVADLGDRPSTPSRSRAHSSRTV